MGISVDNPHTLFSPHTGQSYYALDGSKSKTELGFRQSRLGNPDARWEKNISGNVGFDANLFDSKLIIMAEYFWKDTKDLLYAVSLPGTMGLASAPSVNVGHVNNRGIDASVETSGSISRDLNYNATLTFSTYKNEIVYIADGIDYFGGSSNYNTLGYPMNSYYGYKREGFWQSQEEIDKADEAAEEIAGTHYQDAAKPGRWKFADTDGDGVITPDDRTILGDPHPDFTYGLSLGLDYKRFDLDLFFYGSQGHEIWAYYKRYLDFYPFLEGGKSHDALYRSWGSYYLEDNKDAILPIQENVASDASTEANNDFFVRDGSFLKLKEIILGYRLPNEIINKIGASNLRVFAQLSNILTITGYDGLDPEIYGMDHATYAHHPVYQIGINVTF